MDAYENRAIFANLIGNEHSTVPITLDLKLSKLSMTRTMFSTLPQPLGAMTGSLRLPVGCAG